MGRTSPDWTTCSCSSYGTGDRVLPTGTSACANGAVMRIALDGWPNQSYYALMKDKGMEARDRVKAIVGT